MAELIKHRDGRYWVGAASQDEARDFASSYGTVVRSKWAGPGHYRSDVYIVDVTPETGEAAIVRTWGEILSANPHILTPTLTRQVADKCGVTTTEVLWAVLRRKSCKCKTGL